MLVQTEIKIGILLWTAFLSMVTSILCDYFYGLMTVAHHSVIMEVSLFQLGAVLLFVALMLLRKCKIEALFATAISSIVALTMMNFGYQLLINAPRYDVAMEISTWQVVTIGVFTVFLKMEQLDSKF